MCPTCIAAMALALAGATSAGGLTALAMRKLRGGTGAKIGKPATATKGREAR